MLKQLLNKVLRSCGPQQLAADAPPIIGETRVLVERRSVPSAKRAPIMAIDGADHAPNLMPMIGIERGLPYARGFAMAFVAWVRNEGLQTEWQVDALVAVAARRYAHAAGVAVPVERNLLMALKRVPGVTVKQDRRVYDGNGSFIGKRTFYTLPSASASSEASNDLGSFDRKSWAA